MAATPDHHAPKGEDQIKQDAREAVEAIARAMPGAAADDLAAAVTAVLPMPGRDLGSGAVIAGMLSVLRELVEHQAGHRPGS